MKKYRKKNIFLSLKQSLIGRINDTDIKLIKERLKYMKECRYVEFDYYIGYAKIIYYNNKKDIDYPQNKQWLKVKQCIDNVDNPYIIGSTTDTYTSNGKTYKYFKYFRYYHKYHILELVSDYYNKIPIFYHLYNGEYEVVNNTECIDGIDYIPRLF